MTVGTFVGREEQLRQLDRQLALVRAGGADRPGKALLVRGRRRVGKSRLVEEFIDRSGVPSVYFTASMQRPDEELRLFAAEVAASNMPGADTFRDVAPESWEAALRLLATIVPTDSPSILVIDELPYLTGADQAFEGTLQKVFDRVIAKHPVLLIGIGSDLAMMEALNGYGRPFHQRAREMVVPALSPREVAAMLGLSPADAFDAYLVTGGLPLVCAEWPTGADLVGFLTESLSYPTSALVVSGERALAAEFPADTQARHVLSTVGAGERTFTAIGQKAGGLPQASLGRSLAILRAKRVVAADLPLSTKASKDTRYRVDDPYLRFWLSFIGPHLPEIERGRGDRVLARITTAWPSWRGRTIEPVIRESLARLGPAGPAGADGLVGGYWTRTNHPEIDIVIADRQPAKAITAVGSIKWFENASFDRHDLAELVALRRHLPGATEETMVFAVSRSGGRIRDLPMFGPGDLLAAW